MRQVAKTIGRKPKELDDEPLLNAKLSYLWALFVSLKNASDGTISYTEIQSYISIYGDLSTFEVDAVRALDALHLREANNHGN